MMNDEVVCFIFCGEGKCHAIATSCLRVCVDGAPQRMGQKHLASGFVVGVTEVGRRD